jgi:hypothetical protein
LQNERTCIFDPLNGDGFATASLISGSDAKRASRSDFISNHSRPNET